MVRVRAHTRVSARGRLSFVSWHDRRLAARTLVADALNEESASHDADTARERKELLASMRKHLREAVGLVGEQAVDVMSVNEAFAPMER